MGFILPVPGRAGPRLLGWWPAMARARWPKHDGAPTAPVVRGEPPPETAPPHEACGLRLTAYPFATALESIDFVEAVCRLPGVTSVRVRGFSQFSVAIEVELAEADAERLCEALRCRFQAPAPAIHLSGNVILVRFWSVPDPPTV